MGRNSKPRNRRTGPQNPAARAARHRLPGGGLDMEMGPMTYQGRVITAELIERMRAEAPEHAHQLDDGWAQMVLENNRPWIEDAELLTETDAMWAAIRQTVPGAFECGPDCDDDQPHLHTPPGGRAPGGDHLDPVEVLLSVDDMTGLDDFEEIHPDHWRIDGRPLTRDELAAILNMQEQDFLRYHALRGSRQPD